MNIGQLKRLMAGLPDHADVLLPAPDHSYRRASAEIALARFHSTNGWSKDDGEEAITNELGTRFRALIIT